MPVRRSNQLSYEATDVGSWSFVGSNVPVMNESTTKWYMKWIIYWTADMKSSEAMIQNCVHNCEDHSFTWFHTRSSIYDSFHISFCRWDIFFLTRLWIVLFKSNFWVNAMCMKCTGAVDTTPLIYRYSKSKVTRMRCNSLLSVRLWHILHLEILIFDLPGLMSRPAPM